MVSKASQAGRLIPYAKLPDEAVLRVLQGFARGETVAAIATSAGISERSCRSIVLALRPRLLGPRFYRWSVFYQDMLLMADETYVNTLSRIHGHYAKCYFNRTCYSNYRQGLRETRVCRSCPIDRLDFLDEDERDAARYQVDLVQDFYELLGIRGERGLPPLTVFRLRYHHTLVVGEAFQASRRAADAMADMRDKRDRSAWSLYQALIKDLTDDPLLRSDPPVSDFDTKHGDLSWLD